MKVLTTDEIDLVVTKESADLSARAEVLALKHCSESSSIRVLAEY